MKNELIQLACWTLLSLSNSFTECACSTALRELNDYDVSHITLSEMSRPQVGLNNPTSLEYSGKAIYFVEPLTSISTTKVLESLHYLGENISVSARTITYEDASKRVYGLVESNFYNASFSNVFKSFTNVSKFENIDCIQNQDIVLSWNWAHSEALLIKHTPAENFLQEGGTLFLLSKREKLLSIYFDIPDKSKIINLNYRITNNEIKAEVLEKIVFMYLETIH